jgi:osmotically-inducible protein OsmY
MGPSVTTNPGAGDNTGGADNTRLNARDRNGTLTPIDQGNSKAEIGITASIRRGVMGDHSLSFTAKNVKIITVGTRVTLRGPVKSDAERTEIENLARQTAGVTDVDDQLEVKN